MKIKLQDIINDLYEDVDYALVDEFYKTMKYKEDNTDEGVTNITDADGYIDTEDAGFQLALKDFIESHSNDYQIDLFRNVLDRYYDASIGLVEDYSAFYTDEAETVYEFIQNNMTDYERQELYRKHNGDFIDNDEESKMEEFWDWIESLDSDDLVEIGLEIDAFEEPEYQSDKELDMQKTQQFTDNTAEDLQERFLGPTEDVIEDSKEKGLYTEEDKKSINISNEDLPDMCYVYVYTDQSIGIVKKYIMGYFKTDVDLSNIPQEERDKWGEEYVRNQNERLGISEKEQMIMSARSMFGWDDKKESLEETKTESEVNLKVDADIPMWIKGTVKINDIEYEVQAKVFLEGSEFGIDKGPISKLTIKNLNDKNTIVNFDRGWDIKPSNEEDKKVYEEIVKIVKKFRDENPYKVEEAKIEESRTIWSSEYDYNEEYLDSQYQEYLDSYTPAKPLDFESWKQNFIEDSYESSYMDDQEFDPTSWSEEEYKEAYDDYVVNFEDPGPMDKDKWEFEFTESDSEDQWDVKSEDFSNHIFPIIEQQCNHDKLILMGSSETWQGTFAGGTIINADENDLRAIMGNYDEVTVTEEDNKQISISFIHHDGTNVMYLYTYPEDLNPLMQALKIEDESQFLYDIDHDGIDASDLEPFKNLLIKITSKEVE